MAEAVRDGSRLLTWEQDSFAFADSYDEGSGRYRGLRAAQQVDVAADSAGLLVKPSVAKVQLAAEAQERASADGVEPGLAEITGSGAAAASAGSMGTGTAGSKPVRPTRFHGSVELNPARVGHDAGKIAMEVIAHLEGLVGAKVEVTLEISASVPDGVPENVVRTVSENARTLKFGSQGFEVE
ncbi:MAG: hypothetical protein LC667_09875 [Thioalkalivibrio sp.]|nr:hypothetical protein [Thioalkalivibrio sp.]